MFIIEKNIPIHKKSKYPFNKMLVGDSFFISATDKDFKNARCAACNYAIHHKNYKFCSHVEEKDGIKGIRIWRIASKE
jgi:hypothetical protein